MTQHAHKNLGFGLGLRAQHYPYVFEHWPAVDWFEIISENFMDTDGRPIRHLARIKERYPVVMHGVSLSIGTVDPMNSEYLKKLKKLMEWAQPAWISDHLCWTGVAHKNIHDLLPVPYTEEALRHIVARIKQAQDYLERPIAFENPSTYLEFASSSMPEAEFIARMAEDSGCHLLLDVNNVYVTCYNHRLDAQAYLDALPLDRVIQIHLSGHSNKGNHIVDTHDDHVVDEVWNLYKYVILKAGRTPNTMIEWDERIPEFPVLLSELEKAKSAAGNAERHTLPRLARERIPQRQNTESSLADTQRHMQDAILLGASFDSKPERWIRGKEEFAPQAQLDVYVNAYRYRLYDATAEDYPVLRHYLGDKAFHALIWAFVNEVTSTHFNIARYLFQLPEFMRRQRTHSLFAEELVQLETAITRIADLEETEPLTQRHLSQMTPAGLMEARLYPRQALQLFTFRHAVNRYYCAVMEEEEPDGPEAAPSYLAVFRHEDTVWRMDLEEREYSLLTNLFNGMTVGEALGGMETSAAEEVFAWFSRWIGNGLLAAHEYHNEFTLERYYAAT